MIDLTYLEALKSDLERQLAEHENNAAAARGALQILDHLIQKGATAEAAALPAETIKGEITHEQ
jgi:hypothetical protein